MDSTRYGVKKTAPVSQKDIDDKMLDLRDAENAKTEAVYDEYTGSYKLGTKIGDSYLNAPFLMTRDEYDRWSLRRSMAAYFHRKNQDAFEESGKKKFDFTDMKFDLGPAEKIFGPGGVQAKVQGEAELKIGVNMKDIDNPSLPIRNRKTTGFDFDEKVNVSLQGKIGDKMDMNLNYNTEASFDYDMKNLKLKYEGKEDEIIKLVEAGNISFPSNNSLVTGASSLFGLRTDMQFGERQRWQSVDQLRDSGQRLREQPPLLPQSFLPRQLRPLDVNAARHSQWCGDNAHRGVGDQQKQHYDEHPQHSGVSRPGRV